MLDFTNVLSNEEILFGEHAHAFSQYHHDAENALPLHEVSLDMHYFVYLFVWDDGMKYVGVNTKASCTILEFFQGKYNSSSGLVLEAIANGKIPKRYIIGAFDNTLSAEKYEGRIQKQWGVAKSHLFYNRVEGCYGRDISRGRPAGVGHQKFIDYSYNIRNIVTEVEFVGNSIECLDQTGLKVNTLYPILTGRKGRTRCGWMCSNPRTPIPNHKRSDWRHIDGREHIGLTVADMIKLYPDLIAGRMAVVRDSKNPCDHKGWFNPCVSTVSDISLMIPVSGNSRHSLRREWFYDLESAEEMHLTKREFMERGYTDPQWSRLTTNAKNRCIVYGSLCLLENKDHAWASKSRYGVNHPNADLTEYRMWNHDEGVDFLSTKSHGRNIMGGDFDNVCRGENKTVSCVSTFANRHTPTRWLTVIETRGQLNLQDKKHFGLWIGPDFVMYGNCDDFRNIRRHPVRQILTILDGTEPDYYRKLPYSFFEMDQLDSKANTDRYFKEFLCHMVKSLGRSWLSQVRALEHQRGKPLWFPDSDKHFLEERQRLYGDQVQSQWDNHPRASGTKRSAIAAMKEARAKLKHRT